MDNPSYTLDPLDPESSARWDELIADFEGRELFHSQAWLDYLAASRGVEIRRWSILSGGSTVGYFCGGVVRKGLFRILGSPLKGWGTNFMGPLIHGPVDQANLLRALDRVSEDNRIALLELEYRGESAADLAASGFEAVPGWTYVIQLSRNVESAWSALDSTCRNRIRKSIRSGLVVEDTSDASISAEFYQQYSDLMRRKGLVPPYPSICPRMLVQKLKPCDRLLALRVRDADGRVLATGLFPHDDRTVYFWGGASWQDGRQLCPNEFLHWSAIRLASERGLERYDMCGYGRFKKKFGGELVNLQRWHKCYSSAARWARRAYEAYFQRRIRVQGWLAAAVP